MVWSGSLKRIGGASCAFYGHFQSGSLPGPEVQVRSPFRRCPVGGHRSAGDSAREPDLDR